MTVFAPTGLRANVVTITSALAQEWLDRGGLNRPVNPNTVARYVRDITNGNWQVNGESIIFGSDGKLLDGQHRLLAIVSTKTSVQAVVVEGVAPDAFATIDTGTKRSPGHSLGIAEIDSPFYAASTVNYFNHLVKFGEVRGTAYDLSRPELLRLTLVLQSKGDMLSLALQHGIKVNRYLGIAPSLGAALYLYVGGYTNPVRAGEFFDKLALGDNLSAGNPIFEVRNYLAGRNFPRGRNGLRQPTSVIVQAWNNLRRGYNTGRVTYSPTRAVPRPV